MSSGYDAEKELESEEGERERRQREVRGVEDRGSVRVRDPGTLGPRRQRSWTHSRPLNVKMMVWETHVGWDSANTGDQEGLKMTKKWTGLPQQFSVEEGYRVILQASSLVGNYA